MAPAGYRRMFLLRTEEKRRPENEGPDNGEDFRFAIEGRWNDHLASGDDINGVPIQRGESAFTPSGDGLILLCPWASNAGE